MIYGILTVLVILAVFAILIWIDERRSWGSDPAAQSLARHHISILEGVSASRPVPDNATPPHDTDG